eukprot:1246918-Pyramimonas_sp.AAC.1
MQRAPRGHLQAPKSNPRAQLDGVGGREPAIRSAAIDRRALTALLPHEERGTKLQRLNDVVDHAGLLEPLDQLLVLLRRVT